MGQAAAIQRVDDLICMCACMHASTGWVPIHDYRVKNTRLDRLEGCALVLALFVQEQVGTMHDWPILSYLATRLIGRKEVDRLNYAPDSATGSDLCLCVCQQSKKPRPVCRREKHRLHSGG